LLTRTGVGARPSGTQTSYQYLPFATRLAEESARKPLTPAVADLLRSDLNADKGGKQ